MPSGYGVGSRSKARENFVESKTYSEIVLVEHFARLADVRAHEAGEPDHRPAQHAVPGLGSEGVRGNAYELLACRRRRCSGQMPCLIPRLFVRSEQREAACGIRRESERVGYSVVHEPRWARVFRELVEDQDVRDARSCVRTVEIGRACDERGDVPARISSRSIVATFARTSPFLLHGLNGVSSVIGPLTLP